ncbi:MAG: DUF1570 domain-containing protein [Planctomycetota bacterium]|nr:MAG: DUF1570 domain-containing protein [Planctomycetota bacterium]
MNFSLALILFVVAQIQIPEVRVPEIRVEVPPPGVQIDISVDLSQGSSGQDLESILIQERRTVESWAKQASDTPLRIAAESILKQLGPTAQDIALSGSRFEIMPDFIPKTGWGMSGEWLMTKSIQAVRDSTVEQLWKVARKAAQQERFRITDQALRVILRRDTNQPEAWRLLGYLAIADGWATPYAEAQKERKRILHKKFGWIDEDWIEPLSEGQLPVGVDPRTKKVVWGPASQANSAHSSWENAWEIVTEHFRIRSNLDFDQAVAFGRKLESFYQFFFSQMADLIGPELPLARRWRIKTMKPAVSPIVHQVAYFANKAQYVKELTPLEGEVIAESIGYYRRPPQNANGRQRGGRGMSYFFQDTGGQLPVEATLYHEASHQLLFETAGRDRLESNRGHYWLFEGLGTCFETVQVNDGESIQFAEPKGARMDVARKRILEDHVYTSYEVFEAYGQSGFNQQNKIHDHYAQAMAMTLYFMVGADARTRDIFLDYVRDSYKGRMRGARGLPARLGLEPNTIDESFIRYLKKTNPPKS